MYVFFSLGSIGRRRITESKNKTILKFMDTYWQIIFPNKCITPLPRKILNTTVNEGQQNVEIKEKDLSQIFIV